MLYCNTQTLSPKQKFAAASFSLLQYIAIFSWGKGGVWVLEYQNCLTALRAGCGLLLALLLQ